MAHIEHSIACMQYVRYKSMISFGSVRASFRRGEIRSHNRQTLQVLTYKCWSEVWVEGPPRGALYQSQSIEHIIAPYSGLALALLAHTTREI